MMHVTGIYAALGALLIVVLAIRVVWLRNKEKVGIGAGGNERLARAIRAHANAVEYLPTALLLLLILDLVGTEPWLLHLLGIVLIVVRVVHALGLSSNAGYSVVRLLGMVLTLTVIIAMIALLLWRFVVIHATAA